MSNVNLIVEQNGKLTQASFSGELTIYAMESLMPELQRLVQAQGSLTLNFEQISELDGSGLQFIQIIKHHRQQHLLPTTIQLNGDLAAKMQNLGLAESLADQVELTHGS